MCHSYVIWMLPINNHQRYKFHVRYLLRGIAWLGAWLGCVCAAGSASSVISLPQLALVACLGNDDDVLKIESTTFQLLWSGMVATCGVDIVIRLR